MPGHPAIPPRVQFALQLAHPLTVVLAPTEEPFADRGAHGDGDGLCALAFQLLGLGWGWWWRRRWWWEGVLREEALAGEAKELGEDGCGGEVGCQEAMEIASTHDSGVSFLRYGNWWGSWSGISSVCERTIMLVACSAAVLTGGRARAGEKGEIGKQ